MRLVITEKPSVARSIADVIGAVEEKKGYLEGEDYLVSWCVGHLVELAPPEDYSESLRKWSYESLPIIPEKWKYVVKNETRLQFTVLKKLMSDKRVDSVICATDVG